MVMEIQIQDHERYICVHCGMRVMGRKRFGEWCHIATDENGTDWPPLCPTGISRARPMPDQCLRTWEEHECSPQP